MPGKWGYTAGEYGNRVRVYERPGRPGIWARHWDPDSQAYVRRSLGHDDRVKARAYAHELSDELARKRDPVRTYTLSDIIQLYLDHKSPQKGRREQDADQRRAELWLTYLGADFNPLDMTVWMWERFCQVRSAGVINARGELVDDEDERRQVGPRTVEADGQWLEIVFNWATRWRDRGTDRYLLDRNPLKAEEYEMPHEKNPRRPVATETQYQSLLSEAISQTMEVVKVGETVTRRSHLYDLLVLANETGRRISAICRLRKSNWYPSVGPHGAIKWPADTDKIGVEWFTPVNENCGLVMRSLASRAETWLFWAPRDQQKPLHRRVATAWLWQACDDAGIPRLGWHSFRRKWASDRKAYPAVDVARAGGWTDVKTMMRSYQHADWDGILKVIQGGKDR